MGCLDNRSAQCLADRVSSLGRWFHLSPSLGESEAQPLGVLQGALLFSEDLSKLFQPCWGSGKQGGEGHLGVLLQKGCGPVTRTLSPP